MKLKKREKKPGYDGNPFAGAPFLTEECPECHHPYPKDAMVEVDGVEICAFCATEINEDGNCRVAPCDVNYQRGKAMLSYYPNPAAKRRRKKARKTAA